MDLLEVCSTQQLVQSDVSCVRCIEGGVMRSVVKLLVKGPVCEVCVCV